MFGYRMCRLSTMPHFELWSRLKMLYFLNRYWLLLMVRLYPKFGQSSAVISYRKRSFWRQMGCGEFHRNFGKNHGMSSISDEAETWALIENKMPHLLQHPPPPPEGPTFPEIWQIVSRSKISKGAIFGDRRIGHKPPKISVAKWEVGHSQRRP